MRTDAAAIRLKCAGEDDSSGPVGDDKQLMNVGGVYTRAQARKMSRGGLAA